MNTKYRKAFQSAVERFFIPLIEGKNLNITHEETDVYIFFNTKVEVLLELYWAHVPDIIFNIIPNDKKDIGIKRIAQYNNHDMANCYIGKIHSEEDITLIIKNMAELFQLYCIPLMEEDFSSWDKYLDFIQKQIKIEDKRKKKKIFLDSQNHKTSSLT